MLREDEHFLTLLRAEGLEIMPAPIWSARFRHGLPMNASRADPRGDVSAVRERRHRLPSTHSADLPVPGCRQDQQEVQADRRLGAGGRARRTARRGAQPGSDPAVSCSRRSSADRSSEGPRHPEVDCLVSTDDEAFTYNKRISRLSAVQEHKHDPARDRARRARGEDCEGARYHVAERQAQGHGCWTGSARRSPSILKDKQCPMAVFEILRKMKALRQIEAAELLVNANNYSVAYASAILAGDTAVPARRWLQAQAAETDDPEAMARIEGELARLQESFTSIQDFLRPGSPATDGHQGYVAKLLGNARIVRYLDAEPAGLHGRVSDDRRDDDDPAARGGVNRTAADGDPDPTSAGTAGDAARWGGSSAVVGMAANPSGAHQAGLSFRWPLFFMSAVTGGSPVEGLLSGSSLPLESAGDRQSAMQHVGVWRVRSLRFVTGGSLFTATLAAFDKLVAPAFSGATTCLEHMEQSYFP